MTKNEMMAALAAIHGDPQVTMSVVDSTQPDEYLSDLRIPALAVHHYDDSPYIVVHSTLAAPPPESSLYDDNATDDENPFRRTADGRRATPLPLPSPMSGRAPSEPLAAMPADVLDSLLPPISKLRAKPSPPPMQTVIKGGWRFDVAPREDRTDTSGSDTDRLHPASADTLRQLVKLHGAPAILEAVQKIVDADAYARLNAKHGSA